MSIISKGLGSFKRGGLRGLGISICRALIDRLSKPSSGSEASLQDTDTGPAKPNMDISSRYWFVADRRFGQDVKPEDVDPNTINWVLPDFTNSSGGHLTIVRLISNCEKLGFKNRIVIGHPLTQRSSQEVTRLICENFLPINCPVTIGAESLLPAYFTFATNWTTAYMVRNFASTVQKCYIIQDYEPYFYPPGTDNYLAAQTYDFGFHIFAGGDWLAGKLKSKHNVGTYVFNFACDENFYANATAAIALAAGGNPGSVRSLLFYCRPSTPRRGFELGMMAVERVLQRMHNVQVLLAGCDLSGYLLPPGMTDVGIVPLAKLPVLYRTCDAALVISFTNVSLLPLDLMASNCAVVSNTGPQVEWLLNDKIAELADPNPSSLSLAIERILADDALRARKVEAARNFVAGCDGMGQAKLITDNLRTIQRSHLQVQALCTPNRQ